MDLERHTLTTARLRLEPTRAEHAALVFEKLSDERNWEFFPELRPTSLEDRQALYRLWEREHIDPNPEEHWEHWVVFLAGTDTPIGAMQGGIFANGIGIVAFIFYPEFRGKGYGREAVRCVIEHLRDEHSIQRVRIELDPQNFASIKLVETLGLTRVAERKGVDRRYGLFGDEYVYELAL